MFRVTQRSCISADASSKTGPVRVFFVNRIWSPIESVIFSRSNTPNSRAWSSGNCLSTPFLPDDDSSLPTGEGPTTANTVGDRVFYEAQFHHLLATRDHSSFTIGAEEFVFYHEQNHTELHCRFESGSIEKNRHRRMQEALGFALCLPVWPSAVILGFGGKRSDILYAPDRLATNFKVNDPPFIAATGRSRFVRNSLKSFRPTIAKQSIM
jgi:hypothetical protein